MVSPKLEEGVADRDSLARTGFPVLEHGRSMPVSKSKAKEKRNIYEKMNKNIIDAYDLLLNTAYIMNYFYNIVG